jgi:predicted Zn-dependent protease
MTFTFEDIDNYLGGEMDAEQKLAFEQQLKVDDQLRRQVEEFRFLQTTINKHQQAEQTLPEFKKILTPLTQTHFRKAEQQKGGRVISMNRIVTALALAASIALIFFIALPGVSVDGYPVDDMSGAITRGNEDELSKAAQLFNDEKYAEAATVFQQLKTAKPNDATIDYHLGISLLKTNKDADALPLFEALTKGESVYKEDANFFAAVCAYHLKQNDKAKQYAGAVKKESKFYKYAKAVLKKAK